MGFAVFALTRARHAYSSLASSPDLTPVDGTSLQNHASNGTVALGFLPDQSEGMSCSLGARCAQLSEVRSFFC